MQLIDMTGQRYGRLTVLERAPNNKRGLVCWVCRCDCGKIVTLVGHEIRRGNVTSCGCFMREQRRAYMTKHGGYYDRLHLVWTNMLRRCRNPHDKSYSRYGGRGISVCDEWLSYQAFKDWALAHGYDKDAPTGECTLDRINVDGNYCPANCRFISMAEQARNKSTNAYITVNGVTRCREDWARIIGTSGTAIYLAEKKWGIPAEQYISKRLRNCS